MGLETGTYIDALVPTNPASTDGLAQADDHLRLIKITLGNTFPSITGSVSTTQDELNVLEGILATTAELNFTAGVTSNIQTQMNTKAPLASPTFTGTVVAPTATITTANVTTANVTTANVTTANATTVDLGDWTITQSGSNLVFSHSGTARFKLSSSGALTVEGDITAFGAA